MGLEIPSHRRVVRRATLLLLCGAVPSDAPPGYLLLKQLGTYSPIHWSALNPCRDSKVNVLLTNLTDVASLSL